MAIRFRADDEPYVVFDPMAVPPRGAANIRFLLREMILVRDTGRGVDGRVVTIDPDVLLDVINRAEVALRPHASGLLS